MNYLHNNKEEFHQVIELAEAKYKIPAQIIEKDYYITLILKGLAQELPFAVFKGGTSLSKCHHVINRFSEDIDITIDTKISQGQMKNLKQNIVSIVEEIGLSIPNLNETRSRRSYNKYIIPYQTVLDDIISTNIKPEVLMETSFTEVSFPVVEMPITSLAGNILEENLGKDKLSDYGLQPVMMKVQSVERTLADKVFAVCDYYLTGKIEKHSRHLYDIYKLSQIVKLDDSFKRLVKQVREVRKENSICPSAQDDVNITELLNKIISGDAYKNDYNDITVELLNEEISYDEAKKALETIANSAIF